ncbi:hypothetical protein CLOM_g13410 [Closterium sp. NIES-68]|nr:hypothetical protein CLOM_g13410 [Closterium sp. NIES-68]GJP72423.1 hypothetical protein CLOP_g3158 [Closterium sp. NIES-67]
MTKLKLAAWFLAIALLATVTLAQKYPLCPFTGLPPTKTSWKVTRCPDAAEMTCCKDCSDKRYALAEVSANVTTLISTVDSRLTNLLSGKDTQLCSSFVGFRDCQDLLEQMICATGCNPDSGKYLELPPGKVGVMRVCSSYAQTVYDKCKDLPLPGFQGPISTYFNSGEKLMTTLFGRVGQAFDAINYTVQVTPTNGGTDKCYNGPKQIPTTNVCCDPLPATPDCPLEKLNVTMNPAYGPFVGRTIADPTCPAAQGSGSVPLAETSSSASPPPPKPAERVLAWRVVFNVLALGSAAFFLLL